MLARDPFVNKMAIAGTKDMTLQVSDPNNPGYYDEGLGRVVPGTMSVYFDDVVRKGQRTKQMERTSGALARRASSSLQAQMGAVGLSTTGALMAGEAAGVGQFFKRMAAAEDMSPDDKAALAAVQLDAQSEYDAVMASPGGTARQAHSAMMRVLKSDPAMAQLLPMMNADIEAGRLNAMINIEGGTAAARMTGGLRALGGMTGIDKQAYSEIRSLQTQARYAESKGDTAGAAALREQASTKYGSLVGSLNENQRGRVSRYENAAETEQMSVYNAARGNKIASDMMREGGVTSEGLKQLAIMSSGFETAAAGKLSAEEQKNLEAQIDAGPFSESEKTRLKGQIGTKDAASILKQTYSRARSYAEKISGETGGMSFEGSSIVLSAGASEASREFAAYGTIRGQQVSEEVATQELNQAGYQAALDARKNAVTLTDEQKKKKNAGGKGSGKTELEGTLRITGLDQGYVVGTVSGDDGGAGGAW